MRIKRFFTAMIAALFVFFAGATLLTACKFNKKEKPTDGVLYEIKGFEAYVVGYKGTEANVRIAEKVGKFPVTSIDTYAFSRCDVIRSVEIPDTIKNIDDYAFYECDSLISVVIPDSVTSIGYLSFGSCDSLNRVVIGNGVTNIAGFAFEECYRLVEVVNKSTHITVTKGGFDNGGVGLFALAVYNGVNLFMETNLYNDNGYIMYRDGEEKILVGYNGEETDWVIPSYITKINKYTFYGCDSVTSVVIPDSVKSIEYEAFRFCRNLIRVVISGGITSIDSGVFEGCINLTSVEIPDGVKSIGHYAFRDCIRLTSVVIPDSVESIESYAFYGCERLANVILGDSLTSIAGDAFEECHRLVEVVNKSVHITVNKGDTGNGYVGQYALAVYNSGDIFETTKLSTDNGYVVYTEGNEKILIGYNGEETDLVFPSYITKINQYAFYDCGSLTSVVIPDSVTCIGNFVFRECDSLTRVVISENVTMIGSSVFYDCDALKTIVFKDASTWYYTSSLSDMENKTGGTEINLENQYKNAKYFKEEYRAYYWYKL